MCAPTWKYTGDINQLQTKTKDFKAMANMNAENNRKAIRFAHERDKEWSNAYMQWKKEQEDNKC